MALDSRFGGESPRIKLKTRAWPVEPEVGHFTEQYVLSACEISDCGFMLKGPGSGW